MLILLNKPFRVLSQFTDNDGRATLGQFVDDSDAYPAGRLDYDSEGLLLLTDDGRLQARISQPRNKVLKTYWAQVEGVATDKQLAELRGGVILKDGRATALNAKNIAEPIALWPRIPPIRVRKTVSDSWIELTINEGRNRQVRRMTAAVGLPTLRLIRSTVGPWSLDGLKPGQHRAISTNAAWRELNHR